MEKKNYAKKTYYWGTGTRFRVYRNIEYVLFMYGILHEISIMIYEEILVDRISVEYSPKELDKDSLQLIYNNIEHSSFY